MNGPLGYFILDQQAFVFLPGKSINRKENQLWGDRPTIVPPSAARLSAFSTMSAGAAGFQ
jgi:hypothetical protein